METVSWDNIGGLVTKFGAAGTVALVFAWSVWKGKLRPEREFIDQEDRHAEAIREAKERHAEVVKEKDMWRDMALRGAGMLERAVSTAQTVASTAQTVAKTAEAKQ
jgi:hypothetical protein